MRLSITRCVGASDASQHLHQRNTSEEIEQVWLIFEEATVLQKLLIGQLNGNLINSVNSYCNS